MPEHQQCRDSAHHDAPPARVRFRHYKGGLYELVCEATLESDLSTMVVYRAADGSIWCRPKAVFFESIEADGVKVQRFTPLD